MMKHRELSALAAAIVPAIRDYVDTVFAPLVDRLKFLEERPGPAKGEKGEPCE